VVEPGGRFALASCSSHVTEDDLLQAVAGLAPLRLRVAAGAASDHPVLPAFPEGRYLKFLFFDVE
jgi:23S rRNA (cytosine1962-C5)-methyltransferase